MIDPNLALPSPHALWEADGVVIDGDFAVLSPWKNDRPIKPAPRAEHLAAKLSAEPVAVERLPAGLGVLEVIDAPRWFSRGGGAAFWSLGVLLVGSAFWASGGHALFTSPEQPSLRRGDIVLSEPHAASDPSGVQNAITLTVEARNDGRGSASLPAVAFCVTTPAGRSFDHLVSPRGGPLPAGGRRFLSARLALPPEGMASVRAVFVP